MTTGYVHGYSGREATRLGDQADTLAELLHADVRYPPGTRVLEAGCGVGAQTVHLLANNPGIELTAVDRSAESVSRARSRVAVAVPSGDVSWLCADLADLPYPAGRFDALFVCFVLEHLPDPVGVLRGLRRLVRPGGAVTVIEGDHGTAVFHPRGRYAQAVVDAQVAVQAAAGGDALIGRRLRPLLTAAGCTEVRVWPRTVYADAGRPGLMDGFTRRTFTAMMAAARTDVLAAGLLSAADWRRGMTELAATAVGEGTFHYTFFAGHGSVPAVEVE
jgi:SAM-dependent methyltransferase